MTPFVAALASFVWPGLGQLGLGQPTKGWVLVVAAPLTCSLLGVLNVLAAWDAWILAGRKAAEARELEPGETVGGLRWLKNAALFAAEAVSAVF